MGTEEMMNEAKRAKTYRRQVLPRPQDRGLSEAWRSPRRLGRSSCRRFPPWSACPGSPTRISLDCRVCTPRSVPPPQEWRLWACCRRSHPAWCSPSLGTDSESSTRIRETPSVVCSKQFEPRLKKIIFDGREETVFGDVRGEGNLILKSMENIWISLFHLDFGSLC